MQLNAVWRDDFACRLLHLSWESEIIEVDIWKKRKESSGLPVTH
jgi:hypothetical protein